MNIGQIAPAVDYRKGGWGAEQLFITGQKGTGKSTLERRVIATLPDDEIVLLIDSKRDWPNVRHWVRSWSQAHQAPRDVWRMAPTTDMRLLPAGRWVYRPHFPEATDPGVLRIYRTALQVKKLRKRSCTIVLDELGDLSPGGNTPILLGKLLRESRSLWVRLIVGCQRPASVSLLAVQEATKVCAFHLANRDNRKRLADWVDPRFMDNPPGWFDFHFADTRAHTFATIAQPEAERSAAQGAKHAG